MEICDNCKHYNGFMCIKFWEDQGLGDTCEEWETRSRDKGKDIFEVEDVD